MLFLSVVLFIWAVLRGDAVSKENLTSLLCQFNCMVSHKMWEVYDLECHIQNSTFLAFAEYTYGFLFLYSRLHLWYMTLCHYQISANWLLLIVFIIGQEVGSWSLLWVKVVREFFGQNLSPVCLLLAFLYLESVNCDCVPRQKCWIICLSLKYTSVTSAARQILTFSDWLQL
jgi:hypothetical protein